MRRYLDETDYDAPSPEDRAAELDYYQQDIDCWTCTVCDRLEAPHYRPLSMPDPEPGTHVCRDCVEEEREEMQYARAKRTGLLRLMHDIFSDERGIDPVEGVSQDQLDFEAEERRLWNA